MASYKDKALGKEDKLIMVGGLAQRYFQQLYSWDETNTQTVLGLVPSLQLHSLNTNSKSAEWTLKHQMVISGLPTPSPLPLHSLPESPDAVNCLCKGRAPRTLQEGLTSLQHLCSWPDSFTCLRQGHAKQSSQAKKHPSKTLNIEVQSSLQQPSKINYWHLPCSWRFTEKSPSC